jgi:hypothetical protein
MTATSANIAGLIGLSTLGWVPGDNLFTGGLRDDDDLDDLQVSVSPYSGVADETFAHSDFRPGMQVTVRGDRDSPAATEKVANDLWLYLANVRNVAVPATIGSVPVGPTTIQALTPSGTVNPLGKDDQERSLFSMNFMVADA